MHKTIALLVCFTMLFVGATFADDEVGPSSIVVTEEGLTVGYVVDGYGTSAAMLLAPSVHDGSYDFGFLSGEWSVNPYVRYAFADVPADMADLGGGFALKAGVWKIELSKSRSVTVSLLGTADVDFTKSDLGIRKGRFGWGGMIDVPIMTW